MVKFKYIRLFERCYDIAFVFFVFLFFVFLFFLHFILAFASILDLEAVVLYFWLK